MTDTHPCSVDVHTRLPGLADPRVLEARQSNPLRCLLGSIPTPLHGAGSWHSVMDFGSFAEPLWRVCEWRPSKRAILLLRHLRMRCSAFRRPSLALCRPARGSESRRCHPSLPHSLPVVSNSREGSTVFVSQALAVLRASFLASELGAPS